jgi:hypothetical protein
MAARSASQSRATDSTSVLSTDLRSNAEWLMTLSTSAVAVCCCSDSRSSLSSRVFSNGDHGLRGEILDQLDVLGRERPDLLPVDAESPDQLVFGEHRHS